MLHTRQLDELEHGFDQKLKENDFLFAGESLGLFILSNPHASMEEYDELLVAIKLLVSMTTASLLTSFSMSNALLLGSSLRVFLGLLRHGHRERAVGT